MLPRVKERLLAPLPRPGKMPKIIWHLANKRRNEWPRVVSVRVRPA